MLVISGPFELWAVWMLKRRLRYKTVSRFGRSAKEFPPGKDQGNPPGMVGELLKCEVEIQMSKLTLFM